MKPISPNEYARLLQESEAALATLEQRVKDKVRDRTGRFTALLSREYRFRAIAYYLAQNDAAAFRGCLVRSARLRLSLLERFDAGEPIEGSYASITSFRAIFDALAASDGRLARSLAALVGGRNVLEHEIDYSFARAFGYTLKAIVLGNDNPAALRDLESEVKLATNRNYRGYATAFRALRRRDSRYFGDGVREILEGHRREIAGNAFYGEYDADMCVWGLALVNLAFEHGVEIRIDDPLIPAELIKVRAEPTSSDS